MNILVMDSCDNKVSSYASAFGATFGFLLKTSINRFIKHSVLEAYRNLLDLFILLKLNSLTLTLLIVISF